MAIDQIYPDSLDTFTDREQVIDLFNQVSHDARAGQFQLLAVKGNSGTGKSFLIDYLEVQIHTSVNWQSGRLSFAQLTPDFHSILQGIESGLQSCVPRESLKQYRVKRDEYNRYYDEYKGTGNIGPIQQIIEAKDQSLIAGSNQSIQINTQLSERESHLRTEWSRALIELSEESERPLCLFIDGYERLAEVTPELINWLWEDIFPRLAKAAPQPLIVMTFGWEWPSNATIAPFMRRAELSDFDTAQVKSYLEKLRVLTSSEQGNQELIDAFYDLTKGHPLVLGYAVTYFLELDNNERTVQNLRARTMLIDEKATVGFLQDRLLNRLPEPDRTILERGPILRSFDQETLKALLDVAIDTTTPEASSLSDRSYIHFCNYPFVNRLSGPGSDYSFHSLTRRVGLEMLRDHPQTKEQLHRKMVEYYRQVADREQKQSTINSDRLGEETEEEFKADLERLYHALQVNDFQADAFKEWKTMIEQAMLHYRQRQIGPLLDLVLQLGVEGEPFLSKISYYYGQFLYLYSGSLKPEFRYNEILTYLEEAKVIFERGHYLSDLAKCLGAIGQTYYIQGNMKQAIQYYEQALPLSKQVEDNISNTIQLLASIGYIFVQQGELDKALNQYDQSLPLFDRMADPVAEAQILEYMSFLCQNLGQMERGLRYCEQLLPLYEKMSNSVAKAQLLNKMGFLYQQQMKWDQALDYYQQSLPLLEVIGNPFNLVGCIFNIGLIQQKQGRWDQALKTFERALDYLDKVGSNPAVTIQFLGTIGPLYQQLGEWDQALKLYERALPILQKIGDPAATADIFTKIGFLYQQQMKWDQALDFHHQALPILEAIGDASAIVNCLNNIGSIYQSQGKWDQALDNYKKALDLHAAGTAQFLNNIGALYQQQQLWEQALNYYERALPIFEITGNFAAIPQLLSTMGSIYSQQGEWEKAIEYYTKVLAKYDLSGYVDQWNLANTLEALAACYEHLGEHQKSTDYQERAKQLRESMQKIYPYHV